MRFCSHLTGDMVKVLLTPEGGSFVIHKELLPSTCHKDPTVRCRDQDYIFWNLGQRSCEHFIRWLYGHSIEPISQINEETAKVQVADLIHVYIGAYDLGIRKLRNAIMDCFIACNTCRVGFDHPTLINFIYSRLSQRSPLKQFVIDQYIFKSSQ